MFAKLVAKPLEINKDECFLKSRILFKNHSLLIRATNIWKGIFKFDGKIFSNAYV